MFEKNLNIGYLLDFYGEVLTDRKKDALDAYYNNDMSLAEIAEDMGISRQGVRDIIKKSEEELLFYEEIVTNPKIFRRGYGIGRQRGEKVPGFGRNFLLRLSAGQSWLRSARRLWYFW